MHFLEWEDIQELLQSNALSSDSLATCIENAGIIVDDARALDNSNAELTFEMFYDLIQLIDTVIDHSKLSVDDATEGGDEDDVVELLKGSMQGDQFVAGENNDEMREIKEEEEEEEEGDSNPNS